MVKTSLVLTIGVLLLLSCSTHRKTAAHFQQQSPVFEKGEKNNSPNFSGDVWLLPMVVADTANPSSVGHVTFAPGARTAWHLHPGGQVLLITGGAGFYQEAGSPKRILRKGDVVRCPPNIRHWHGATDKDTLYQVAITNTLKGPVQWGEQVSEATYRQ